MPRTTSFPLYLLLDPTKMNFNNGMYACVYMHTLVTLIYMNTQTQTHTDTHTDTQTHIVIAQYLVMIYFFICDNDKKMMEK